MLLSDEIVESEFGLQDDLQDLVERDKTSPFETLIHRDFHWGNLRHIPYLMYIFFLLSTHFMMAPVVPTTVVVLFMVMMVMVMVMVPSTSAMVASSVAPSAMMPSSVVLSMMPAVMPSLVVPSVVTSTVMPSSVVPSATSFGHMGTSNGTQRLGSRFVDRSFPLEPSFLNQGFESSVDQSLLLGIHFLIVSGPQMLV